jgi:hypothetical protein
LWRKVAAGGVEAGCSEEVGGAGLRRKEEADGVKA